MRKSIFRVTMAAAVGVTCLMMGFFGAQHDASAQTRQNAKNFDKAGKFITEIGSQVTYAPADIAMSAATLPASNVVSSLPIDMSGVKELTIFAACGQIADLRLAVYAEDGTTVLATLAVDTGIATSGGFLYIGNEAPANVAGSGTLAIAGIRTPMKQVAIVMFNTTATPSTCTVRAIAQY